MCTLNDISFGTGKLRLPSVSELFWGLFGGGEGGLRGLLVSGSGYNEVLVLEVLNVISCIERKSL